MIADDSQKYPPLVEKIPLRIPFASVYEQFKDSPYSAFLDSALTGGNTGRFSFIGVEPFLVFSSKKNKLTITESGKRRTLKGNPFIVLKELLSRFRMSGGAAPGLPFTGGAIGYFSYDLKDFNERLPDRAADDINAPDAVVCFYDTIIAFDHFAGECFIASSGFPEKGKKRLYRQRARLESMKNRVLFGAASAPKDTCGGKKAAAITPESNFTKRSYISTVLRAKEYIKKGDIYQVNLSQRFKAAFSGDPFALYSVLRAINPAPFAGFLNFGDVKILSASPERFLKKEGSNVETRPIKGTRPRGKNRAEDEIMKKELISCEKDRAENLMIIDLERNDLGRISEYGTVTVSEFMTCEEYATVFHLVSAVEGKLRDNVEAVDCLVNCFPGGSITGAPKIRSMEIIEELEPVKRSVYTGSIGYIGFNGNMDTSVVIRTFILKDGVAYFQVGGGIVHDSNPEKEYQETLDKGRALMEALSVFRRHCEEPRLGGATKQSQNSRDCGACSERV